jgi:tetratricopeptide (TPR) repeat protein
MRSAHRGIGLVIAITACSLGIWSGNAAADEVAPKDRALQLFRDSDLAYQRGEFERAIELLRESYDVYPEPLVLYNLARALEGAGDFEAAVAEYERYLRSSQNLNDRGGIERRVVTLKAYIAAAGSGRLEGLPTSTQIGPATGPPSGGGARDRGARAWIPWAIAGAGVAVVAAGAVTASMSDSWHDEAVREPIQAEAVRLQDKAEDLASTGTILLIGGGALAVGGTVWGVIELRRGKRAETPRPGSARLRVAPAYVGVEWTLR